MVKKVVVGSNNPAKVAAVRLAVELYWPEGVEVVGVKAESSVSAMPTSDAEMVAGAQNRCVHALELCPDADVAIAVEGGTQNTEYGMFLTSWTVARTRDGAEYISRDPSAMIPEYWQQAISHGAELRPLMIATGLPYDEQQSAIGFLTRGAFPREFAMSIGARLVLAPIANPNAYKTPETYLNKVV